MSEPTNHLHVEFYTDTEKNDRLSAEQGRPIFEDKEFVRIRFVGDKHNVLVAPALSTGSRRDPLTNERMTYAQQFPKHYEAFKANMAYRGTGSPLEALGLSQAKIAELNASNIHTVEGLAGLDGSMLQKLGMGARALKTQAEQFLAKSTDNTALNRLEAENAEMRRQLDELMAKVNGASASFNVSASPFADWDDDTIRLWIEEQGGEKPHHKCSHETLVQKADELNAALASKNKAA